MPGILCDTILQLRSPIAIRDDELDTSFNTYLASCNVDGHHFAFSVAQPVPDHGHALLPHGVFGDVHGSLTLHKKSLLFTATTVTGMYVPLEEQNRRDTRKLFQPTLSFVGTVKRVHTPSLRNPAVKVIDVSVDCGGVWPYEDTVLTCYFNSRQRLFKDVVLPQVGMSLSVSGELVGWDNGKLAVDVQNAMPNHVGELPGRLLSVLPNLFEKIAISNNFAVFTDPSSLPPRAGIPGSLRGARTTSAQWLEIVAGLPANASTAPNAQRSGTSSTLPAVAAASSPGRSNSTTGVVARRSVAARGTQNRRTNVQATGRSPLSELDMNVPAAELVSAT